MLAPVLIFAAAAAACVGDILPPGADPDARPDPTRDATRDGAPDSTPGDRDAAAVCERWNSDRADITEGTWSGDVDTCDAGDTSPDGRDSALRLINLYRWLARLPAVETEAGRDAMAQACALMMHANRRLSHEPPDTWECYSEDGSTAARRSNIATTRGTAAIDLYMVDPGNETTIGHRRWILSNGLGPVGLGSTSSYSCMWVINGAPRGDDPPWIAYPPPGPFPYQAVRPTFRSIDETGWTVQSNAINLAGASVTVTAGGEARPVQVRDLLRNYGSSSAISCIPQGWTTEPGQTYRVEVTGIDTPITYHVEVVDCS